MNDIFKLLESQGYRHGGPIRYFDEGGYRHGGPIRYFDEGGSPRGGGDFGGTGSHSPGPSGPSGGDPGSGRRDAGGDTSAPSSSDPGRDVRNGENLGGMGSATPSISGDPRSGDDGNAASSEPSMDRSFTVSSAPAAYSNVKPGESAFAQYGATTATNIHNQAEQSKAEGVTLASILGREPNYGELSQLSDSGMGSMEGVNPNNLTGQTVDHMLAAQDFAAVVDKYAIPALSALVPNFAIAYNLAKVASGDITVGQALTSFATSYAAKALGVSPSVLGSMVAGNFGQAVASQALGSITQGIAKASSVPGGLVAFGLKESGAGQAISRAINGTIGNSGAGVSTASIASSIDKAVSGIGGAITGSATTAGTTGTGAQPLSLDPVDNILNSSSNAPTINDLVMTSTPTAPIASAPSMPNPSASSFAIPVNTAAATPYNGAEIDYLYDVGGSNIFAPQKAGTPKPDVLKYLQTNVATAAQGGSITDLLDYVRK